MSFEFEHENLRDGFDKWKFIYGQSGTPDYFHTCKHRIAEPDLLPHSHPFFFKSRILKGSYIEREFVIRDNGTWYIFDHTRTEDDAYHIVEPDTVHQIIALPNGPVWTEIEPWGEHQPEYAWKFEANGIFRRLKGTNDFLPYKHQQ